MNTKAKPIAQAIAEAEAPKRTRKTRQPVKPISKTPEQVAANAAVERQRKAASKKALRESLKPEAAAKSTPAPRVKTDADRAAEHAAYLEALRIDAEALGVDPDAYIAQQLAPVEEKTGYTGPMIALKTAVKRYVKAPNGQPCNGDEVATLCGQYSREVVVAALIDALQLPGNPYVHLNPGQQSMNLRNKARHAVRTGLIQLGQIAAALIRADVTAGTA